MRNYETLPYSLGGSDLDILVAQENVEEASGILYAAARTSGGRCIMQLGNTFRCFCGHNGLSWWGVRIDIHPRLLNWLLFIVYGLALKKQVLPAEQV